MTVLYIKLFIAGVTALAIVLVVISFIRKIANEIGLVDKPNPRKVHRSPIPVIGGLAIGITLFLSILVNPFFYTMDLKYLTLISSSIFLLALGILDDKLDLKASHRLFLQATCGYAVAASGVRLYSLYGVFGIHELSTFGSYGFTIFLIAGVLNAFNLIDGINGLAGLMALIGFLVLGFIAFKLGNHTVLFILIILIGSIIGFLKHNLIAGDIFLGDGGSLFLGFNLVTIGILLIEESASIDATQTSSVIACVFGIFVMPVLDSIRVYYGRMKNGFSPFRADKTHLHHLLIFFNVSHSKASLLITCAAIFLIGLLYLAVQFFGLSISIILLGIVFILGAGLLAMIKNLEEWKKKIKQLEEDF